MDKSHRVHRFTAISIVCVLLIVAAFFAGCTTTTSPPTTTPPSASVTTLPTTETVISTPQQTTAVPSMTTAAPVTATPLPNYTPSQKTLIVYTAASLTGVSKELGSRFSAVYPSHSVIFNLAGTQTLKTQVENGAYADVFVSASNSYTNTLKGEGYFIDSTVKPLTTNYVIVILPASNTGNIQSLSDLANPGKKIAMAAYSVPIGTVTYSALANLAKSTYGQDWNKSVFGNVVTYETSEPGVATKVSLGEVDAGLVYESTYAAAPAGTLTAISIPKTDNVLQTYTIGVMKQTANSGVAQEFEDFMLSSVGQQILKDYGFRPVS
ncbi:MAG: molybdate ABC transporter substrate-binding protein [Methanoregula sp.]|jgi:molybdate transport system substrate-binding protein|nr:molybdate ABC transporter substrate-binding protein [Methanoregula sp.]